MRRFRFFAPCPAGVESLLAEELAALGIDKPGVVRAGVSFAGTLADAYRVALWSRLASRLLLSLAEGDASSADTLYEAAKAIPWEHHVRPMGTFAIDAQGTNAELRDTRFTTLKVKDAIADRLRDLTGERPSVDIADPDVRVNVSIRGKRASISLDLSGEPLHRRGYREPGVQVVAPMKENLAAAVLAVAGWSSIAAQGGGFVDPMCGSGTLAIEAAMIARDVAPGLLRARWGFDRWLGHDEEAWHALLDEADNRAEAGREGLVPVMASDIDARAIEVAQACVKRAGLAGLVEVRHAPLADAPAPATQHGLVAVNPPYGERLEAASELMTLYAELGRWLRSRVAGWRFAVITPDDNVGRGLGLPASARRELYNGRILAPVTVFEVPGPGSVPEGSVEVSSAQEQTPLFRRLAKMAKHHGKWARRTGVTCYRVYDADLPDYPVTVDLYQGAGLDEGRRFAVVAEYAAPAEIPAEKAEQRFAEALSAVSTILEVAPEDVFAKRRERQRGTAQYGKQAREGVVATVSENGLLFEVNLSDYLDTGLFLDHRDTRAWLRESAEDARFLNLFAYTGTATVYAAAGGARSTTTVDLSATYLDWAKRNLELNKLDGAQHRVVRADVTAWLAEGAGGQGPFDLVFCDPPTFSNSKRMDASFDVQRDHVQLLSSVAGFLAPGGTIVFSCNRRGFVLDEDGLADNGLIGRDVTSRTIPADFARKPGVHSCWTIRQERA